MFAVVIAERITPSAANISWKLSDADRYERGLKVQCWLSTQLKRSWRAELPVLDIIRIPPAANSSGGCTRATRASATASTRVSPLFADFCSQILPTVVLHQREANAPLYPVFSCKLGVSEGGTKWVCQVAASGRDTMRNNSRIRRTVKIYRPKIPAFRQDEK